ncbi:MAG TPA: GAF domain-containing protein [Ktedonobacterales bacterium]|nr:GAF domain-containing protein [Ktedonobacterales bacterium]
MALTRAQQDASLELRDYVEMLRPTASLLDEAICVVDLASCIQFANPGFERLLGRAESELLKMSAHEYLRCGVLNGRVVTPDPANDPSNTGDTGDTGDTDDGRDRPGRFAMGALGLREALRSSGAAELSMCELKRSDGATMPAHIELRRISRHGRMLGATLVVTTADTQIPLANKRLAASDPVSQSERRMRMLEAVGDIALTHLPLDELLSTLLERLRCEMELENIAIFLINETGDMVTARAASGVGAETATDIRVPLGQSIIGDVMRDRKPVFITDIPEHTPHSQYFISQLRAGVRVRSLIMVPLIVEERVIGALYVGASEPHRFTRDDARLIEIVGGRAALAIERARASDEAARAHERLRFLNDASDALNATLDIRDITRRLTAIVSPALGDACAVYLLEDDGLLRKVAMRAPAPGLLAHDPINDMLQRLVERLAERVEVSPDDTSSGVSECVRTLSPVFERFPIEGATDPAAPQEQTPGCLCVCMPLAVRQHALGALYLAMRPSRDFSDGDLELIQGLSERAAIAIDNARLYNETQQALASGSATATQLDTIFNATDVGIFVTDNRGAFLRINPCGARLLGLPYASLEHVSQPISAPFEYRTPEGEAIPFDRQPLHLARVLGRPIEQRFIIHRFDSGKDIQALTRCTPWRDEHNQIAGAIGVVTDITAIHELERQKDEFLGIASHELKTPLTTLKILAQLMARRMVASDETREIEQAQRMQVAITRMERLINDLLDVSLIQDGKLALHQEMTDLCDICEEAVNEQRVLAQRDIRLITANKCVLPIYADRERIYQVISNLLSNALKYSPATESVIVRVWSAARERLVTVHDHGPGIPPEAMEHIFERFFRVPGMQVQSGSGVGLGLGLHISNDIITRHGGRIWAESELGHGSVFWVALPEPTQPGGHDQR